MGVEYAASTVGKGGGRSSDGGSSLPRGREGGRKGMRQGGEARARYGRG